MLCYDKVKLDYVKLGHWCLIYYGMGRYVRLGLAMLGRHWLGRVVLGKVRLCRH